ncbi:MAG: FHA domain-containing protein [Planctomycetota bacterium]|nr:MAG: FHA domain-containing protein [Planctomycetota bacterium]
MYIHLEVIQGPFLGKVFTFKDPKEIIIGRSSQADLTLQDERISRRHCRIEITPNGIFLHDLGSRNGTFLRVKGNPANKSLLVPGDIIYLGTKNAVRFHLERDQKEKEYYCEACGKAIQLPTYANGEVAEIKGKLLCPNCSPKLDLMEDSIPGYRLERKIGEGAMGSIYKAVHLKSGEVVALKLMKFDEEPDRKVMARFQREAIMEGSLDHPNIVKLYEFGSAPPYYFIALEYVEGASLLDIIIEHGPMEPAMALNVAIKVSRALEHAFSKKIVHRDVKPSNIMISSKGEVKLADFGLAKNFELAGLSMLTTTGTGIGTPAYMPPEQVVNARFVDQRADIYSLGVTMYVALTGYRPFSAKSTHEYLQLILNAKPMSILQLRPSVPPELVAIVEKCMEKAPENRYQTPSELLEALVDCAKKVFGKSH